MLPDDIIDTPEEVAEALKAPDGWPVLVNPCPRCGARVAIRHRNRAEYLGCVAERPCLADNV